MLFILFILTFHSCKEGFFSHDFSSLSTLPRLASKNVPYLSEPSMPEMSSQNGTELMRFNEGILGKISSRYQIDCIFTNNSIKTQVQTKDHMAQRKQTETTK